MLSRSTQSPKRFEPTLRSPRRFVQIMVLPTARYALLTISLLPLLLLTLLSTLTHAKPSTIAFYPSSSSRLERRWPHRRVTVRHYTLNVTSDTIFQSCEPFGPTSIVNSTLPGPLIRARAGEILQVRVYNHLNASVGGNAGNLTVHFHGLSMRMHPVMDGTMMLSQWPIQPGHYFDYRIPLTAEDKGTYFYHSHVGVQAMTAYGAVVIEDPEKEHFWDPSEATWQADQDPKSVDFVDVYGDQGLGHGESGKKSPYWYDEDKILAIGDWFSYNSVELVQKQLKGDPFVWPGSATKLLLNGKSSPANFSAASAPACNQTKAAAIGFECSSVPAQCSQPQFPVIQMDYDKTYRLRFIGATALMYVSAAFLAPTATPYTSMNATSTVVGQTVAMDKMTLIEADGSYLDPYDVDHVELTTGQRYSALYRSRSRQQVQKDGTGGVYWMRMESRWRAGPSQWVKIVYPAAAASNASSTTTAAMPPLKLASNQTDVQLLPKETFGWVTSALSPLSKPNGPEWWYSNVMPTDDQVTRTVVIDVQQVKFYPSQKGIKWDQNGNPYNESDPGTDQPYLVRTFLGDIDFPTSAQFQSAMYNPTNYTYDYNATSANLPILDLSNASEVAAASRRRWNQGYSESLNMYFAQRNEVVDIVLINKPSLLSAAVEIHPWHMHSHKHWTRTIQPGTFSFTNLESIYAATPHAASGYNDPIQRDTTIAYASPGAAYLNQNITNPNDDGGWAVLRYKVDPMNAGVFLLHCHIQFHLEMGMATVWTIAPDALADKAGIYWPTTAKNQNVQNVQGLDADSYLQFGKDATAIL